MKISVIGLGKLGLPLAVTIASKGFEVVGVDINEAVISNLSRGLTTLNEPGLQNLITKHKTRLKAIKSINEAIIKSEITFIITPTPSMRNGYFSLEYIKKTVNEISKVLKVKKGYHLVVVVSTVMPGSTDEIKKILEKNTGKICGKDFGLCYNPEFIALGSVINNLLNPDFILIGESDKKAGNILEKFYGQYCDNKPEIAKMNFVNAELTKISVNTFVTTKISYANMLSEICENLPGGNVDVVTSTLGLDSRIGKKYLKGGPAFGGPCFPRDNVAFISLAKKLKVASEIPDATHRTNINQIKRLTKIILKYYHGKNVGILGLSYKPFTDVIEESAGMILSRELKNKKIKLNLHDPLGLENAKKILSDKGIKYFENLKDCVRASDVLVITTNWPEYKNINDSFIDGDPKIIIDPWRMLNPSQLGKKVKYIPLGINIRSG